MNKYHENKSFCEEKLKKLEEKVLLIPELKDLSDLTIYATGSYARKEANLHSDIDLFFVNQKLVKKQDESWQKSEVPKLKKIKIDAALIDISREMKLPEFSADGQYLEIHHIKDLTEKLGSIQDDYNNFFTARLLLLLESSYVFNEKVYNDSKSDIIDRYYLDFHDHHQEFQPLFLCNDIIRYWKTLTLNYEHKRNRVDDKIKPASHLNNLKLKFSRKLTCFSILYLILYYQKRGIVNRDIIMEFVKLTPFDRLIKLSEYDDIKKDNIEDAIGLYMWFLNYVDDSKENLKERLKNETEREHAFLKAKEFGENMSTIFSDANETFLKYLI